MFLNPIKRSKEWLKEGLIELFDNITETNYKLLFTPQGVLFVVLLWVAADIRFFKPGKELKAYFDRFILDQANYSLEIESNPNLKREFDFMLLDDLSALRSIYHNNLNDSQYDDIAYLSKELRMSPFRFIKLLQKTDMPFFGGKLFDVLKSLKESSDFKKLRPMDGAKFEFEFDRRGNLGSRGDLSKELSYRLNHIQYFQNSFLTKFQKDMFFEAYERKKMIENAKRKLKERALPRGPQSKLNRPRLNRI